MTARGGSHGCQVKWRLSSNNDRVALGHVIGYTVAFRHYRAQHTISFPIGGHVNVLSDCKETVSEKNVKFLQSHCSHVTDMLITFRQNHIFQAFLKNACMCTARQY